MKIEYHCAGCNNKGVQDIKLNTLIEKRKGNEHIIDLMIDSIDHKCDNPEIGIRILQENHKEHE